MSAPTGSPPAGVARAIADRLLEMPAVYRAIQAPFAEAKLEPFLRRVDPGRLDSVLDVGCGPGTNARHFEGRSYVGIDVNPGYIATARARFQGTFLVGDVTDPSTLPSERFECVFANSLFHHIDDAGVRGILKRLATLVAPGGALHVLDLVLPARPSVARLLARLDRGKHPRPVAAWLALFTEHFTERASEQYAIGVPGVPLWRMLYFQGVPR